MELQERIEKSFEKINSEKPEELNESIFSLFNDFKDELNSGRVRAAEKRNKDWIVNLWVKKGILLGFRIGKICDMSIDNHFFYYDKDTYPLKHITISDSIRIVPGGSSIRDGCFLGRNVICMPPMYINVGAYIDNDTMIDSHALIGSCAQIGKRVHISAAAQIGGVLEPVGSLPVIIEDDVIVGGNCGIYDGTIIRTGAVIGAGTIITGSTPVYDLVLDKIYEKTKDNPLVIPANAVVIPGTRPVTKRYGRKLGISVYTPIIIKYRDQSTNKVIQLEDLLR